LAQSGAEHVNDIETPLIRLEPPRRWGSLDMAELWRYRNLCYYLAWRDVKARYKQTALGLSWAIFNPLAHAIVFTIIFGRMANLPTDGIPRPLFYFIGLVLWKLFATSVSTASLSLVKDSRLVTKIYFPRLFIPISACAVAIIDFAVSMVVVTALLLYWGVPLTFSMLFAPVFALLALVTAIGIGLVFSVLYTRYHDINSIIPFVVQLWMYLSVILPFSRIPESYGNLRYLYGINPMAGTIEGFRWSLTSGLSASTAQAPIGLLVVGIPVSLLICIVGVFVFKRFESTLADVI